MTTMMIATLLRKREGGRRTHEEIIIHFVCSVLFFWVKINKKMALENPFKVGWVAVVSESYHASTNRLKHTNSCG